MLAVLAEKQRRSLRLDPERDCLFCTHQLKPRPSLDKEQGSSLDKEHHASDLERNLEHMVRAHSFFVPEVEFVVDLRGMMRYLCDKVSVQHVCLYCDHQGARAFHSLEAVRKHMVGGLSSSCVAVAVAVASAFLVMVHHSLTPSFPPSLSHSLPPFLTPSLVPPPSLPPP